MADRFLTDDELLAGARRVGRLLFIEDRGRLRALPILRGGDGDDADDGADDDQGTDRVDEIAALIADADNPPTLDELQALEAELQALFDAARAERTQAGLDECRRISAVYDDVVVAREAAEEEASRVDAELDELAQRMGNRAEGGPEDGDDEDEGDDAGDGEGDGEGSESDAGDREPVTAGGAPRRRRTRPGGPTGRTPGAGLTPLPQNRTPQGPLARTSLGARVTMVERGNRPPRDAAEVLAAVWEVHKSLGQARTGVEQKVTVVRANWQHPADRRLPKADSAEAARIIDSHLSYQALSQPGIVAAGGICGPLAVDYSIPVLGSDDRPFRDSLPSFQMDRGGLTWVPSPVLATGVPADSRGVWTVTDDEDETPTPKVCAEIACAAATEIEIEALYRCVQMTNFVNRYARERAEAILSLIRTDFARWAETRFLAVVDAGSTAATFGPVLGALRDYLALLGRATAQYRRRHRVPRTVNLVNAFPDWLYDMLREDIANAMPSGDVLENLALADAQLDTLFRSRGVRPVSFMDGANDEQTWADAQAAGELNGWPFRVVSYIYAEGTWVYGDGGELDLGIVRDSTLNSTNRLQMFSEEFGRVFKRLPESVKVSAVVCPNGASAGTLEPVECALS